jgi:hypothetical protein
MKLKSRRRNAVCPDWTAFAPLLGPIDLKTMKN